MFRQIFFQEKKLIYELGKYLLRGVKSFLSQLNLFQEMQLFRKLAGNIFFKIILAFIALSFALFGVSGFILNSPNSWVAKIGGKTISYSDFTKEMQKTRDLVLQNNKSDEALKYLDSDQFKSDTLGRMVNGILVEKLREDFGVEASKKLILEAVAKDGNFKDKDGKFDRKAFQNFLAKNGLDEEKYVNIIQNDVVATMVIQTLSLAAPVAEQQVIANEEFKQEKRSADIIKISDKNVAKPATPTAENLSQFFEAHKKNYAAPETRKVSYFRFSKKDFAKDLKITDEEISAEYEKNKDKFQKPESRDLYHVLFDKEEAAKEFITKLDAAAGTDKSKLGTSFLKLAKELQHKDAKNVTLRNVTQKDLISDLANPVFKMNVGERSEALKSPLGFHVFVVNAVNKSALIPFSEAKTQIKNSLFEGREDKIMQSKVTEIDDAILASNSLEETAKKFNLSANFNAVEVAQGEQGGSFAIKNLDDFSERAFAVKQGEASKLFYSKTSGEYYALQVAEITPARDKTLDEVKAQVTADFTKYKQAEALRNLAKTVAEELKLHPESAAAIISKYKLSVDKNKPFSRVSYITYQGHQIPIQDKFSGALFAVKIGEATDEIQVGNQEFAVGILRAIQKENVDTAQIERSKAETAGAFRNEIMQAYNAFVMKKYPVKVNEKILGKKEQQQ